MARYRTMNWLCRRPPPSFVARLPESAAGLRFECDLRNALAREVYFTGRYEPQETQLVRRLLEPGGVFIDVGAHWGYFSLLAIDRVGRSGRVVAIEADPRIYRTLARNFALNGLTNAVAVHAAAAAEPGVLTLAGYDETQGNWGLSRLAGGGAAAVPGTTFEVPSRRIDDLLDEQRIATVDLLKMDIEGAEVLALQGMRSGLQSGRYRRILLELHPAAIRDFGTDAAAVVGDLTGAGYRGWTIDHAMTTFREAAYGRLPGPEAYVQPFDPTAPLDVWPHQIWEAPGVPPFLNSLRDEAAR
jgi:FkbM family methyltransferase